MAEKQRLDRLLVDRQLAPTRSKAAAMIMAGEVQVNGRRVDKPGSAFRADVLVTVSAKPRYVSRGGLKLEAALDSFDLDPSGKICGDVGASTGGFTDCLLQRGAARVYAIDVGNGIIDYRLRIDERVCLLENTNARYLPRLPEQPDLVTIDVSFISLRYILPAVQRWIDAKADIIALLKPQFEAGKAEVGRGGIVRDRGVHRRVVTDIVAFATAQGFKPVSAMKSPISGAKGNIEFLLHFRPQRSPKARQEFQSHIDSLFEASQ